MGRGARPQSSGTTFGGVMALHRDDLLFFAALIAVGVASTYAYVLWHG